jgi:maleylacetoacetate isomerase
VRLYTYWRSSAAYRVRIALNWKGLRYEALPTHFLRNGGEHRAPAFLARNPQGLIPVLDDGGVVLAQSLAIIEYLEERYPEPPLLPREPEPRARARSLALAIACDIHPLNNLRVLQYLKSELAQPQDKVDAWYRHWIATGFAALEQEAVRHGDGRHVVGDQVSVADLCLVPQVYNARRFKVDLTPYPTLVAINEALSARPAFQAARPEAQPDAE